MRSNAQTVTDEYRIDMDGHNGSCDRVVSLKPSYAPSSISFDGFGTKFWFDVRWGRVHEQFQYDVDGSGNDWNGILFPALTFDSAYMMFVVVSFLHLHWPYLICSIHRIETGKKRERKKRKGIKNWHSIGRFIL